MEKEHTDKIIQAVKDKSQASLFFINITMQKETKACLTKLTNYQMV